jgi:NADH:ubiquinone oxidoreductase subunit E
MKTARNPLSKDVENYICQCRNQEHPESYLISVLQKAQNEQGYLSREAMDAISRRMNVPAATVTGVATFYHFFRFKPKGQHTIVVCMGTACFVRGAEQVIQKLQELLRIAPGETTPDGLFSIDVARCLGACALAPVMVVDGKVFGNVQPADVRGILEPYGWK